jgi:hypothetical protein
MKTNPAHPCPPNPPQLVLLAIFLSLASMPGWGNTLTAAQMPGAAAAVDANQELPSQGQDIDLAASAPKENPEDNLDSDPGQTIHGFFSRRPGDGGYDEPMYGEGDGYGADDGY